MPKSEQLGKFHCTNESLKCSKECLNEEANQSHVNVTAIAKHISLARFGCRLSALGAPWRDLTDPKKLSDFRGKIGENLDFL